MTCGELQVRFNEMGSAKSGSTAAAGAGRMSSEATFVSSTNIRCAAYEKSGGSRMGPRGGSSSSTPPRGAKQSRVNAAKS